MSTTSNMPDATKGATLTQLYLWLYNGGSYGRKPAALELVENGWLPFLQAGMIYQDLTNDDIRFRYDTDGQAPVLEENSVITRQLITAGLYEPSYSGITTDQTQISRRPWRIGIKEFTMAGGALANQELVPAIASYYGILKILGVTSTVTAANGLLKFESPAATAALPSPTFDNAYVANVRNTDLKDMIVMHNSQTDNQSIVVDMTDFGAGADTVIIEYLYKYET